MATTPPVLRGAPGETAQQVADRLTRQSDAMASAFAALSREVETLRAQVKELQARAIITLENM